jgi:hypothetical protein
MGDSIYATVSYTNAVGSSSASELGNGAVIITNPDPPSLLQNKPAITSSTVIALSWTATVVVGGTPVIDYRVSWDQGTGAYVELESGITTTSYSTTAVLPANTYFKFKV